MKSGTSIVLISNSNPSKLFWIGSRYAPHRNGLSLTVALYEGGDINSRLCASQKMNTLQNEI